MAFENGVVPEDWRSDMIVPFTRVKVRGLNVRIIERGGKNICRDFSR